MAPGCMVGRAFVAGGSCMAGETATAADGKHPTGMHSCYGLFTLPYSDTDSDPK